MGRLTHFHARMPIAADGFIHLGNGDVIKPEVLAEGLAKAKGVELRTVRIDHEKDEVRWAQHLTEELARAFDGMGLDRQAITEKYFVPKQAVDRKTVDL